MNSLNGFAQISGLVKEWAETIETFRIATDTPASEVYRDLEDLAAEMRAFSNGLAVTVDIFRPALERADEMVATGTEPGKCPCGARQTHFRHSPSCPEFVANSKGRTVGYFPPEVTT